MNDPFRDPVHGLAKALQRGTPSHRAHPRAFERAGVQLVAFVGPIEIQKRGLILDKLFYAQISGGTTVRASGAWCVCTSARQTHANTPIDASYSTADCNGFLRKMSEQTGFFLYQGINRQEHTGWELVISQVWRALPAQSRRTHTRKHKRRQL